MSAASKKIAEDLTSEELPGNNKRLFLLYGVTVVLAAFFLFFRLGNYALWDDEAIDAFSGTSIIQSGDTSAIVGQNIMGYRTGLLLHNLRVEGEPPFTAYASACSMILFGKSAFAARLPMALFGFATVLLLLWWTWKLRLSEQETLVVCIAIAGSTSLFLFSRQCHYYGPSIFFFTAITYLYLNWKGNKLKLLLMGILSALLMSANYSYLVVLYGCLFLDYLIWQRHVRLFKIADLFLLFLPQLIMGLMLLAWWNPFHTHMRDRLAHDSITERLQLFLWHFRDLNICEFYSPLLLVAGIFFAITKNDRLLRRLLFWLVAFTVGMTILSTQSVKETSVSDIRYFAPIIPLFITIEAIVILIISKRKTWLAVVMAIVVFGTNILNGGALLCGEYRSTIANFVGELLNPPPEPYSPTAAWIRNNVRQGSSIWVLPDYMNYPLMFHAPDAVYAWQLNPEKRAEEEFKNLPVIHFKGVELPNYIIVFGPTVIQIRGLLEQWRQQGIQYDQIYTINTFWKDLYRPELFWRTFKPITGYDPDTQAIYIFKHIISSSTSQKP